MNRSRAANAVCGECPRTLVESVERKAAEAPDDASFFVRDGSGWRAVTNREYYGDVCALARSLRERGVRAGDRFAILSRPCYEWEVADKAIMFLGGITVGLDPGSSADDIAHILAATSPVGLFVEDHHLLSALGESMPAPARVLCVMRGESGRGVGEGGGSRAHLILRELVQSGSGGAFEAVARPGDLAVIIFTSGTTGRPKGIPLTHRQLVAMLPTLEEFFRDELGGDLRTVSWVPLHNGTGRLMSSANFYLGVAQHFVDDPKTLFDVIREIQPTYLVVVPRVLEKVHQRVSARLAEQSPLVRVALRSLVALRRWRTAAPLVPLADRLLVGRVRRAIWGREMRFLICGSAPADPAILEFFDGLGVPTLEVYGLSEIPVLITMTRRGRIRYGSVGEPVPGMEVKIAPDGEVLARHEAALERYWGEETSDLFDDNGYLKTGDLGELRDGYLHLVGRKKEIIKTSTGQRISPAEVELVYGRVPGVDRLVAIGDRRPYLTALVAMDEEFLAGLAERGMAAEQYLRAEFERCERRLAPNRRVKRFAVLSRPLSVEQGELTPTLKVRRSVVEANFRNTIDGLYHPGPP